MKGKYRTAYWLPFHFMNGTYVPREKIIQVKSHHCGVVVYNFTFRCLFSTKFAMNRLRNGIKNKIGIYESHLGSLSILNIFNKQFVVLNEAVYFLFVTRNFTFVTR